MLSFDVHFQAIHAQLGVLGHRKLGRGGPGIVPVQRQVPGLIGALMPYDQFAAHLVPIQQGKSLPGRSAGEELHVGDFTRAQERSVQYCVDQAPAPRRTARQVEPPA